MTDENNLLDDCHIADGPLDGWPIGEAVLLERLQAIAAGLQK